MSQSFDMAAGDVRAWIASDRVCVKAVKYNGDPVELGVSDVRRLAEALIALADAIDAQGTKTP